MKLEHGPIHPGDVDETIGSMSGVCAARDIYERYCEVARSHQRHPGHIIALGKVLIKRGVYRRVVKGRSFYSIW